MRYNGDTRKLGRLLRHVGGDPKPLKAQVRDVPRSQTKLYTFTARPGTKGIQQMSTTADSFSEAKNNASKMGLRGTYDAKVGESHLGEVLITG